MHRRNWLAGCLGLALAGTPKSAVSLAADDAPTADAAPAVRIARPAGGHIHPSLCLTPRGVLVVVYGQVNHRDLRVSRSTDGGRSWSEPTPFVHTVGKTYYPGSLTTLKDGRVLHCWNRWSGETDEKEPRYVQYSLSSDDGATWGPVRSLARTEGPMSVIRHPIVELGPRQWLFSLADRTIVLDPTTGDERPFGDGRAHGLTPIVRTPRGTFVSGLGLRSVDDGHTWTPIARFPDVKTQGWRHEMTTLTNGSIAASEILGPGFGGERIRYVVSHDDGLTWDRTFEYYNPGRAIQGRACPRTVQMDERTLGVVFYDIEPKQEGGPGLFFLRIPLARLAG